MNKKKTRSAFGVMMGLIGMVGPLTGIMILAILLGTLGHLCAIAIPTLAAWGLLQVFEGQDLSKVFMLLAVGLIVIALVRSLARYIEQTCNHYIAFRILAEIRHRVFAKLRTLTPAKLEGRDRGDLIAMITSDVELLEVFYAHTLSPIMIAILTSLVMTIFFLLQAPAYAILGLVAYALVGILIPVVNSKRGKKTGEEYRQLFASLNAIVLDNLRGLDEILQFDAAKKRQQDMRETTKKLSKANSRLKSLQAQQTTAADIVIMGAGALGILLDLFLADGTAVTSQAALLSTVALMSSFGPVSAVSAVSNNLHQTLACGNRVLDLLEESPLVEEIQEGANFVNEDISFDQVSYAYPKNKERKILNGFTAKIRKGKITGVHGRSGSGKSTLLKLMMRFYDCQEGRVLYGKSNVNQITTEDLRKHVSYVEQETFLLHDTIANNIRLGNLDATDEEIRAAAKKASLDDFVASLPKGYDTMVAELGESLSGGERQRIGIARAFVHHPDLICLDEPTSNLDSLNESVILKALKEEAKECTVVLVSHRESTMNIVDDKISVLSL